MDALRSALAHQYRATLAMLRECVEVCPEGLWLGGNHPRNTWRIAYHAVFYAHLYLLQGEHEFKPFYSHDGEVTNLCAAENPPEAKPFTREEVLAYIDHVDKLIEPTFAILDLETDESGYSWYKGVPKLEHEILSIRHIAIHVGQLEELLDAHGIDYRWMTRKRD